MDCHHTNLIQMKHLTDLRRLQSGRSLVLRIYQYKNELVSSSTVLQFPPGKGFLTKSLAPSPPIASAENAPIQQNVYVVFRDQNRCISFILSNHNDIDHSTLSLSDSSIFFQFLYPNPLLRSTKIIFSLSKHILADSKNYSHTSGWKSLKLQILFVVPQRDRTDFRRERERDHRKYTRDKKE